MMHISKLAVTAMVIAALGAVPAAANPGRGHGKRPHAHHQEHHHGHRDADRDQRHRFAGCPPGLARKNPPCVPPGQARNHGPHHGDRVGDVLRVGDFIVIRDPRRYDLPQRPGWDYYRDSDRIYRVDSTTRRVLAIQELIEAFSN